MDNYKAIDTQLASSQNFFKTVFLRKEELKKEVSGFKWARLTIIEVMFGVELLEHLVITASLENRDSQQDKSTAKKKNFGYCKNLNRHIPNGLMTNFFRGSLVEVLYYKYYRQYLLLDPDDDIHKNAENKIIDVSRTWFSARKLMFEELIAFRRVYDLSWLVINITLDLIAYFISEEITIAILTAITVEAIRRFLKI